MDKARGLLMNQNTLANGVMENSMEKAPIPLPVVSSMLVSLEIRKRTAKVSGHFLTDINMLVSGRMACNVDRVR